MGISNSRRPRLEAQVNLQQTAFGPIRCKRLAQQRKTRVAGTVREWQLLVSAYGTLKAGLRHNTGLRHRTGRWCAYQKRIQYHERKWGQTSSSSYRPYLTRKKFRKQKIIPLIIKGLENYVSAVTTCQCLISNLGWNSALWAKQGNEYERHGADC